jgi:tRNA(fMet)-specific endonuclease VapC
MIDLADILIGATALTHDIPLATLNTKHFERIKGLEIIS